LDHPTAVNFVEPTEAVQPYDFVDLAAQVASPPSGNGLTDAALAPERSGAGPASKVWKVEKGGQVVVSLAAGTWVKSRHSDRIPLVKILGDRWTSPPAPDAADWALLLQREEE
jgi:hypothetical protein